MTDGWIMEYAPEGDDDLGPPPGCDCTHREPYTNRFGRDVWRICPNPAAEVIEGWAFCVDHLPPGPKVA